MRKILLSVFLLFSIQNVLSDDKFPGFTEVVVGKIEVYYKTRGSVTDFNIVAPHDTSSILSETNSWISVGFGPAKSMDKSSAIVCKSTSNGKTVQHYYNNRTTPGLIDTANPSIGLTNTKLTFDSQYIICSFTRENSNSNPKYYNINNNPYVLTAWGTNRFTGPNSDIPGYHGNEQRAISPNTVNIISSANVGSSTAAGSSTTATATTTGSVIQTTKSSASWLSQSFCLFSFSFILSIIYF